MKEIRVELSLEEHAMEVKFREREYSTNFLCKTELSFQSGKLYGILCNHSESGWGISYLLAGKVALYKETIAVNKKKYHTNDIVKEGWYMGEGLNKKKFHLFERTNKQQIAFALKYSQLNMTVDEIISKFELSLSKIDNKYSHMSWESWRVSAAIGYAYGKDIFCFPWLDTIFLEDIIYHTGFLFYVKILKEAGNIILLPTCDRFLLQNIADEIITINDSRFHNYRYIEEYFQEQKKIYK